MFMFHATHILLCVCMSKLYMLLLHVVVVRGKGTHGVCHSIVHVYARATWSNLSTNLTESDVYALD